MSNLRLNLMKMAFLMVIAPGCGNTTTEERVIDNTQALPGEITLVSPGRDVLNPRRNFGALREEDGMLVGDSTMRIVLDRASDGDLRLDQVFLEPVSTESFPWPSYPCSSGYESQWEFTVDDVRSGDPAVVEARPNGGNVLLTAESLGTADVVVTGTLARWDHDRDDDECHASATAAIGLPYRHTTTIVVDTVDEVQLQKPFACTEIEFEPSDTYPRDEPPRAAMLTGADLELQAVAFSASGDVVHDAVNFSQQIALTLAWEKDVIRSLTFGPDSTLHLASDPRPGSLEITSEYGDMCILDVVTQGDITRFAPTFSTVGKAARSVSGSVDAPGGDRIRLAMLTERAWAGLPQVCHPELELELVSLTPERCAVVVDPNALVPPGAGPQLIELTSPGDCTVEVSAVASGLREELTITRNDLP